MKENYAKNARASLIQFIQYVIFDKRGSIKDLLTTQEVFSNAELSPVFGMKAADAKMKRFDVSSSNSRPGLLSSPLFLSYYSAPKVTAPVGRGLFVIKNLLCGTMPPPPENVLNAEEKPKEEMMTGATSVRELFKQHSSDPTCASCHRLIDGIGFGLSSYDDFGFFDENADATGMIISTRDDNGPYDGLHELAERLGQSNEVVDCLNQKFFSYFLGTEVTKQNRCAVKNKSALAIKENMALIDILKSYFMDQYAISRK